MKGVTLEENGRALFPDAPTERGVKHLKELTAAVGEGYKCLALFVVQMKGVGVFMPNDLTHPEFGQALREASKAGVEVRAVDCLVEADGMVIDGEVEVKMGTIYNV